jgi:hypothetical protein
MLKLAGWEVDNNDVASSDDDDANMPALPSSSESDDNTKVLSNYAAQSCQSRSRSSAFSSGTDCDNDENLTVAAEMAAAKLERMGTYVRSASHQIFISLYKPELHKKSHKAPRVKVLISTNSSPSLTNFFMCLIAFPCLFLSLSQRKAGPLDIG